MPDDCLICLAPVPAEDKEVVRCESQHAIHLACMMNMIVKMGKDKCPYCLKTVDFGPVRGLRPRWSRRALIALEHMAFEAVLVFLCMFSTYRRPGLWKLNRLIASMRMNYEHCNMHAEGLDVLRAWAVRTLKCVLAGWVVYGLETFLRRWMGECVDIVVVASYMGLLLMYGNVQE